MSRRSPAWPRSLTAPQTTLCGSTRCQVDGSAGRVHRSRNELRLRIAGHCGDYRRTRSAPALPPRRRHPATLHRALSTSPRPESRSTPTDTSAPTTPCRRASRGSRRSATSQTTSSSSAWQTPRRGSSGTTLRTPASPGKLPSQSRRPLCSPIRRSPLLAPRSKTCKHGDGATSPRPALTATPPTAGRCRTPGAW